MTSTNYNPQFRFSLRDRLILLFIAVISFAAVLGLFLLLIAPSQEQSCFGLLPGAASQIVR